MNCGKCNKVFEVAEKFLKTAKYGNLCKACFDAWESDLNVKLHDADPVNQPKHYTNHPSGIECIQITRHMNFNRGNAVKYIWRAGEKSDDIIIDLKKAIWYLQDEIRRIEKEEDLNVEKMNK